MFQLPLFFEFKIQNSEFKMQGHIECVRILQGCHIVAAASCHPYNLQGHIECVRIRVPKARLQTFWLTLRKNFALWAEASEKNCIFAAESCRSGRTGQTRNLLNPSGFRGFESLTFRKQLITSDLNLKITGFFFKIGTETGQNDLKNRQF